MAPAVDDDPPDTVPENTRPTDPCPPPHGADICACKHYRASHLNGGPCAMRCGCVLFAMRKYSDDPDGSDMPPVSAPTRVAPSGGASGQPLVNLTETLKHGALKVQAEPLPPDEPIIKAIPKLKGDGHWLDYGKDTGPRLRVRGLVDEKELFPLVEPDDLPHDPREVEEVHAASLKAFREEDDRALAKIYEDVLDDIHSSDAGEGALMSQLAVAAGELQAAITAELKEVDRAEPNWGWKHVLSEYGIRIRARTPQGQVLECQVDRRGTQILIMQAVSDPRGAASQCVREAREQIHQARARILVGGFVPVVNEVGQA